MTVTRTEITPTTGARSPLPRRGAGLLREEPHHFPAGVGALRVGVGAGGAAARPGVSGAV